MKLKPLADRVILKQFKAEEKTKSGLILAASAQEKPEMFEVVEVGPGGMVDGNEVKMTVAAGDRVIVGMGAIVMNGAVIGEGSIIAAGALVKEGMVVPPYSLVAGVPGVVKKTFEPGQRPQENNDEVYTDDAFAYAAAPHYPVPVK